MLLRIWAAGTTRQSPDCPGPATTGNSCCTSAAARAEANCLAALSSSMAALGDGTASRGGGGWARRMAVAPGLPSNGRGSEPQADSSASMASTSPVHDAREADMARDQFIYSVTTEIW